MNYLFEEADLLNIPVECFSFCSENEVFPVSPHWHYYMEIILMTSGTAEMRNGSNAYNMSKGDMIIFHPKAIHSIYSADGKPVSYSVIKLDISRMNISSDYSPKLRSIFRCAERKKSAVFFSAEKAEAMNAGEIFGRCISEMNSGKYGYDMIIRSQIYILLIEILRCWQEEGFRIDSGVFAEDTRYDIYNITEFIDRNMPSDVKVSEIAEKCGMSYSYFAKKFRSVYGKNCKEYIDDMRVCKAEEFLVYTDFDLTYISQETGFSDCSHMIKSFKKHYGVTPKKFREMKQAKQIPKNS